MDDFEQHRDHLRMVAFRILGSLSDTEDAVQEAWLRMERSNVATVRTLRGWLTTVVARVCLDMLRTRSTRREELLDDTIGDEFADSPGPEEETVLADSVGVALTVILQTLTPAERLALVLHDVFGLPFAEIAPIVDRSPNAAAQLAAGARRRVRGVSARDHRPGVRDVTDLLHALRRIPRSRRRSLGQPRPRHTKRRSDRHSIRRRAAPAFNSAIFGAKRTCASPLRPFPTAVASTPTRSACA